MPTTRRGLPTIASNLTPDIPRDLNALANALDTNMAGLTSGTTFPSTPLDGDLFFKTNDTTMDANGSLYKWDSSGSAWRPCFPPVDGSASRASARTLGRAATQAAPGNDARFQILARSVPREGLTNDPATANILTRGSATAVTVVNPGDVWIDTDGVISSVPRICVLANPSGLSVTVPAAAAGNHRIDAIVMQLSGSTDWFDQITPTRVAGTEVTTATTLSLPTIPSGAYLLGYVYVDSTGIPSTSPAANLLTRCPAELGTSTYGLAATSNAISGNCISMHSFADRGDHAACKTTSDESFTGSISPVGTLGGASFLRNPKGSLAGNSAPSTPLYVYVKRSGVYAVSFTSTMTTNPASGTFNIGAQIGDFRGGATSPQNSSSDIKANITGGTKQTVTVSRVGYFPLGAVIGAVLTQTTGGAVSWTSHLEVTELL